MKTRVFFSVAMAAIVCALTFVAQSAVAQGKPAAQAKPTTQAKAAGSNSLWARVPALPNRCYSTEDQWSEQNTAAFDAVQTDHYKQVEINDGIRQAATDSNSADPMALAARIQQKMMEDPANAQKIMEQMNQNAQEAQVESPVLKEKERQFEAESKKLLSQYQAAFTRALAPGDARRAAINKRLGEPGLAPWSLVGYADPGDPAWLEPERRALRKIWDQAYVQTCASWWAANGQFHAYMKRYKDFLVQERIPHEQEYMDKPRLERYEMLGVAATGWRTTSDYEAVLDYMKMARTLFDQRDQKPLCTGSACGP